MKGRTVIFIIALIILCDQSLKLYIKTHYQLNEAHNVGGSWFQLIFSENPGMAYGLKLFPDEKGKLILSLFRLAAVIFGVWYLRSIIQKKYHKGFIICAALIYAGALGNLIDSTFYGIFFDRGMLYDKTIQDYVGYSGIARPVASHGYNALFYGNVVDMLNFTLIDTTLPNWVPIWGGKSFKFFEPVFNLADASISIGVISLLLFQKRFFRQHNHPENHLEVNTNTVSNEEPQIS